MVAGESETGENLARARGRLAIGRRRRVVIKVDKLFSQGISLSFSAGSALSIVRQTGLSERQSMALSFQLLKTFPMGTARLDASTGDGLLQHHLSE